jgi:hypothetical protein
MFLDLYVDDGFTWDNDAAQGNAFYDRLAKAFSITATTGDFYLGMDIIQTDVRFITLTSETYIRGLCARFEADFGISSRVVDARHSEAHGALRGGLHGARNTARRFGHQIS